MTRRRSTSGRLLLLVGALLLGLVAAELLLRATGRYAPPAPQPLQLPGQPASAEPFSRPDDLLIFSGMPNARTWPGYTIDDHGYRTPPFTDEKPPGTFRVVVTGDSTTFGFGLAEDEHWPALLRRALTGLFEGERAVEVINAGTVGYSTFQNRHQIERDLLPLDPDLVVMLFCGPNDARPVEGPTDAELSAAMRSTGSRLGRLHLARALGLGGRDEVKPRLIAEDDSPTARPRVSLDEVEQNIAAMADLLGDRFVLGFFLPKQDFPRRDVIDAMAARADRPAAVRHIRIVDPMPEIEELLPFPVYWDDVHPSPTGHVIIAKCVLRTIVPKLGLSPERATWAAAWLAAMDGELPDRAGELRYTAAPRRFRELLALYDDPDTDARFQLGEPLPESVRTWDPIHGTRMRDLSYSFQLLWHEAGSRREDILRHVKPLDPLMACFGEDWRPLLGELHHYSDEGLLALGRAALVYSAELGIPPVRADLRRGQAAQAQDPEEALELLLAVLELNPRDMEAQFELAMTYRKLGRRDEERAEYETLATGTGALADLGRGLLAFQDGNMPGAEAALRIAIEGAPFHGWAHFVLGQALFRQDKLDEASSELAMGAVMLGALDGLPAQLALIEKRRAELAESDG